MVDAVVSYAVEKLGTFLIEEVSLRQSLRENVLWLRNELSFMKAFLKDAEKNQEQDNLVQQWVFEITSVANDAVYILEAYSLDAAKDGDHAAAFVDRLKAYACICQKEAKLHNIGKDIQSLKERVMDISRKRYTYGIAHINNNAGEGPSNRPNYPSSMLTLRRAVSNADEDQLFVGFQEVYQRLLDELLKEESHRKVLSIYGMGGLGKTTLARNLYNSPSLITTFHTRAWICVSQQYSTPDLLRSIIKSIEGCSEELLKLLKEMSERELETYLCDLLKERKYLVVVDDVWHREAWESLKRALPDKNNGSRVILTTRKEEVAERVDDKGFSHKLRFLNNEESWDLLCKKLRPENKMVGADLFSPSMERLAKEMVEKCGGLPLAIVVLGGILSYRKGVDEWQKVKTHLWQHMKNDSVEITYILSLSYNDLSFELKQCFLYIGIFQEDHVIDAEKLMHLWLAEGFIPRIREEHMEDIAENFLHELIIRSLIQVAETFFNKIFACKIHDLLRDLAVQKSMEVNLFDIYDPSVSSVTPFRHRHAIHAQTQKYLSLDLSKLKVRSILFFDKEFENLDHSEKFMTFCTTFPHLYVLDLENIYFSDGKLPDAIGNLVHLKFLGLCNTNLFKLPPSIGKLKCLQTLEALKSDHCSCKLPPQVAQLTNLRHLVARYEVPLEVNRLTNLRTLKYIRCDQWKDTDASGLVNLQELGMEQIVKSYSLKSIGSLKSLTTLFLICSPGGPFPPLEPLSSCENLHRLWLSGGIEEVANLNNLPKTITVLVLQSTFYTGLEEDPMPILGKFPNLKYLELSCAYKGKKITCKGNGFGQLETLRLENLDNLESWHLHTTAMSVLKSLSIRGCPKLKKIPERMEHIAVLDVNWCISCISKIWKRQHCTSDTFFHQTGCWLTETHLRNLLKERKYLVVVDDVWHREAWESLKRALLDNKNGSRVILTTRKEDVAERVDDKGFSHKLRFLNNEESWDLLCKKLHPENKMVGAYLFSPSMERLAMEMVDKCRGLPLAIVVLGGILSYRKGVDEWQKVKTHLWQHMKNDSVEITHILSLSYNDLSFELKQCFLYIGIFQEDLEIDAEKLMYLWLAEGFIPRIREEHMEDIAENFLHELISRSLIQVAETFFDKILTCRIHNLLRDLAVQKAMEVNLFDIYDPRNIDFVGNKLPDAIGKLVHLKFLGLSNTNLFKLPSSIGKLKNLQTLEALINDHCSCQLPPQIAKLTNLRHLITRYEVPLQVDRLANLRTLKYIRCDQWKHTDASRLVNLQELGMEQIVKSYSLKSIGSLKSLTTLFLICSPGGTFPPLEPLSSCENLHRLWLSGGIEEVANLNNLPKSITVLVLRSTLFTGLEEDPMLILGKFPNLKHLELSRAYKGKKITCNGYSFGPLETLKLVLLGNLESWHLHPTAMSVLKSLTIFRCPELKKIPERLEHIAVLDGNQSQREYYYRFPN
ncbi:hypothetical protein KY289_022643 [Solanum tuberosum]|nr:hypothetical protein KY289_022643 [Solanum tuberosum]